MVRFTKFLCSPLCCLLLCSAGSGYFQTQPKVIAIIATATITLSDLEIHAKEALQSLESQHQQARTRLFEDALSKLIDQKLLQIAAADRGLTVDTFLELHRDRNFASVTQADVDRWFTENGERIRHESRERFEPRVRQLLGTQRQQSFRAKLLKDLHGKIAVRRFLAPDRVRLPGHGAPFRGHTDAEIVLTLFSDFECPYCRDLVFPLQEVMAIYGDQIKLVFRQFPLTEHHAGALLAAEASLCAADQDRFWEMHDAIFDNQDGLQLENLEKLAEDLGLDPQAFCQCMRSRKKSQAVLADVAIGEAAGVSGTPSLFINGRAVHFEKRDGMAEHITQSIEEEMMRLASPPAGGLEKTGNLVARVGYLEITRQELEERVTTRLGQLQRRFRQERSQLLQESLHAQIEQTLMALEAQASGTTAKKLYETRVIAKASPVSSEEVAAFLQHHPTKSGNVPMDELLQRARHFLVEQRQRPFHLALMKNLAEKYPVHILDPTISK